MNQSDKGQQSRPRREAKPRGFYARQAQVSCNVVVIDPDLRSEFSTERKVNDALRSALPDMGTPPPSKGRKVFPVEERLQSESLDRKQGAVVIHYDNHQIFRNEREVNLALRFLSKKKRTAQLPDGVVQLYPSEGPVLVPGLTTEAPMFTTHEQFG